MAGWNVVRLVAALLCCFVLCEHAFAQFSIIQVNGASLGPPCSVTKNIVADFGATGVATDNATPAFLSFQSFAATYVAANPGNTICLTVPPGVFTFGTFLATPIGDGIPSLVVNGAGATTANAVDLVTTAPATSGTNVLTFASVPSWLASVGGGAVDLNNGSAIPASVHVSSTTGTTVTLSGNLTGNVSAGDKISFAAGGYFLGARGINASLGATVQTVAAGSTSVTLTNPAQASSFTANTFAYLSGVDLEGFGFPPNNYVWEYVFITNVNAGTGVITFQQPTQFSYESTWPTYATDTGGPATIFPMPSTWNVANWYNGLSIYQWTGGSLINMNGRQITCNSCTFTNWGPNISQQQTFICNGCDLTNIGRLETDKMWQNVTFNGGTIEGFFIQSGSLTGTLTLNNVHVTHSIAGTPGYFYLNNSAVDTGLQIGPGFGQTQIASCTNSQLPGDAQYGGNFLSSFNNAGSSMSGGIVTIPLSVQHPITSFGPNVQMFWAGNTTFAIPFSFIDLTADATNSYLQVTTPGGFPALTGGHSARSVAAQSLNFSGCTGTPQVVDLSQPGARNKPWGHYSNRIYTCTNNVATIQAANPGVPVIDMNSVPTTDPLINGAIASMSVSVSPADTGANPTVNFHAMAAFDNYPTISPTTAATTTWGAIINLKAAGTRTYNGTTAAWSGSQSGDTLPTIEASSYMTGVMQPNTSVNLSGEAANACPVVTVTIQTQ
jgi:hypothetical protein